MGVLSSAVHPRTLLRTHSAPPGDLQQLSFLRDQINRNSETTSDIRRSISRLHYFLDLVSDRIQQCKVCRVYQPLRKTVRSSELMRSPCLLGRGQCQSPANRHPFSRSSRRGRTGPRFLQDRCGPANLLHHRVDQVKIVVNFGRSKKYCRNLIGANCISSFYFCRTKFICHRLQELHRRLYFCVLRFANTRQGYGTDQTPNRHDADKVDFMFTSVTPQANAIVQLGGSSGLRRRR